MSIPAFLTAIWGGICSPTGQGVIGLLNLGGTTYTAVKTTQNGNKLSSLQSSVYGIATDLREVKAQTSDLFTIDDMSELISSTPTLSPTTNATTTPLSTAPASTPAPAEPAQDNMPPAWAQQLMQQQLQQAEVIKTLMQQNTASAVPANTTVNVNPVNPVNPTAPAAPTVSSVPVATAVATVPGSVPEASPAPAPAIDAAPASAAVDPGVMAFLQQQADAINKLASAVTALETSLESLEAAASDPPVVVVPTPPVPPVTDPVVVAPPTPPVGGWNDEDEDIEDLIEKSRSRYPASSKKRKKKKGKKKKR